VVADNVYNVSRQTEPSVFRQRDVSVTWVYEAHSGSTRTRLYAGYDTSSSGVRRGHQQTGTRTQRNGVTSVVGRRYGIVRGRTVDVYEARRGHVLVVMETRRLFVGGRDVIVTTATTTHDTPADNLPLQRQQDGL